MERSRRASYDSPRRASRYAAAPAAAGRARESGIAVSRASCDQPHVCKECRWPPMHCGKIDDLPAMVRDISMNISA